MGVYMDSSDIQLTGERLIQAQNRLAINKLIKSAYIFLSTLILTTSISSGILTKDLTDKIEANERQKRKIISELQDMPEYISYKDEKINSAIIMFQNGEIDQESLSREIDRFTSSNTVLTVSKYMSSDYKTKADIYDDLSDENYQLNDDINKRTIFACTSSAVVGLGLFACCSHLFYNKIKELEDEEAEFQASQDQEKEL